MTCPCSICRGDLTKPTGCRCNGDRHLNMACFVTTTPVATGLTVADYLRQLELPDVRTALVELLDRRQEASTQKHERLVEALTAKPSPLPCGCHCSGGCADPYAACANPCLEHLPF